MPEAADSLNPKRNPIKQIMSEVHKDSRAGKLDLRGHAGFIAEVKRRVRAAGLAEEELDGLVSGLKQRSSQGRTSRAARHQADAVRVSRAGSPGLAGTRADKTNTRINPVREE